LVDENQNKMRTFRFTIDNPDKWAITDTEIVVIAEDKPSAKKLLTKAGYTVDKTSELIELVEGIHIIQESIVE
jgi:hypothetical protein